MYLYPNYGYPMCPYPQQMGEAYPSKSKNARGGRAKAGDASWDGKTQTPGNASTGGIGPAKKPQKDQTDTLAGKSEELKRQLEAGLEERRQALEEVKRRGVFELSKEPSGTLVVQAAFENRPETLETELDLLKELDDEGKVKALIPSPHGNHVLQKALKVFLQEHVEFIFMHLKGQGESLAKHRYGCRIMVMMLSRFKKNKLVKSLFQEALAEGKAQDLCRDSFGRHVAEAVLMKGTPGQKKEVLEALEKDLVANAVHKHSSYVIEKVLKDPECECEETERQKFAEQLLGHVKELVTSTGGYHVLKSALEACPERTEEVMKQLDDLIKTKQVENKEAEHASRLLEDLKREAREAMEPAAEA